MLIPRLLIAGLVAMAAHSPHLPVGRAVMPGLSVLTRLIRPPLVRCAASYPAIHLFPLQICVIHEAGEDSGCPMPASSRAASGEISGCAKGGRGPSGQFGDSHSSFCCMIFCEYFAR